MNSVISFVTTKHRWVLNGSAEHLWNILNAFPRTLCLTLLAYILPEWNVEEFGWSPFSTIVCVYSSPHKTRFSLFFQDGLKKQWLQEQWSFKEVSLKKKKKPNIQGVKTLELLSKQIMICLVSWLQVLIPAERTGASRTSNHDLEFSL